jgi:16S rRNA (cytosine967-C5)-methyltransferase
MVGPVLKSARNIAAEVLNQFDRDPHSYTDVLLGKLLEQTNQKQRATDLVFGTIRNRSAIDMVVSKLAECPAERISPKLLNIIRVGTYELVYCPATAEYSVVNEAVETAGAAAGKKQRGFVNAVLRKIAGSIRNRQILLEKADGKKTLPQTPLLGCEFDTDLLPQPTDSPADYLSLAFSLPKWLIVDWLGEFGAGLTRQICFASNRKPSIYLRPNPIKTTLDQLVEKLRQADVELEIITDASMLKVENPGAIAELAGFAEGLFSIQDIAASQPVRALKPRRGWKILDLCAAPGTKTTQLAEFTGDSAEIIATDIDSRRLEKVKENTNRLGIGSVRIIEYEKVDKIAADLGPFDCVLLDVPCSNTGVLAKRPEVRYRLRPAVITRLVKVQRKLLASAAAMVKSDGRLCYSSCSLQTNENSRLVRGFLTENPEFRLESEKLTLPSAEYPDHDGGYTAIITKK